MNGDNKMSRVCSAVVNRNGKFQGIVCSPSGLSLGAKVKSLKRNFKLYGKKFTVNTFGKKKDE